MAARLASPGRRAPPASALPAAVAGEVEAARRYRPFVSSVWEKQAWHVLLAGIQFYPWSL